MKKKLNKTFLQNPEALLESDEHKGREGGGGDHQRGVDRSRTVELLIKAEQKEKKRRAEREKKKPYCANLILLIVAVPIGGN